MVELINALKPTQKGMGIYQIIAHQNPKHQIHLDQNR